MKKSLLAVAVFAVSAASASAHSVPTSYDLVQDGRIGSLADRAGSAQNSADAAYALANTKYTEGAGKALELEVKNKVSQADFKADQQRQDNITNSIGGQVTILNGQMKGVNQTIADNTAAQAKTDAGQDRRIDNNDAKIGVVQGEVQDNRQNIQAGAVRMDGIEKQAGILDQRVGGTEVRLDKAEGGIREVNTQMTSDRQQRVDGDVALNTRIEQEQSNRATQDRVITDRVRKEETNRASADAGLSARIDTKVDNGVFTQRSAVVDQRFVDTQQRIDTNKAEQAKVNKAVASTLDNHEQRLSAVEQNTNSKFANIDKRIDEVKDEAHAGAASAMAQANIPQVMEAGEFGVGAGAGTYAGESAVAVGASFAPQQNLVFKATVSTDTQHNFGAGAGVMVSFR
ncbi:adhesin [Pantoea phage Nafs113]|nr:adhesin [Pantoea phage Nafs113]